MLILYVVCMLFYAIGGFLFVSIFVFKQPNVADAFSDFSVSERDVVWLQCHGERIYILDLTVLTEDKRLVVTAMLLHYLSVGLLEPCTQFRL